MSTSPFPYEALATPEGQAVIRARLVANLAADGQPTSSWAPSILGGADNLRADMVSGGLAGLLDERISALILGRLVEVATDTVENGYFLSYLGLRFYKLPKRQATKTIQNIQIVAAATSSANTFGDGDLWAASPATGNRYRLTLPPGETISVTPGQTTNAPFYAQDAGSSYLDPPGTVTTLVTSKAGLSCGNARPTQYRPTRSTGGSTGTVSATFDPFFPVPTYASVRARIDVAGDIGTAKFSWSTDGGNTWANGGVVSTSFLVPGGGPGFSFLSFANGISPSFAVGTIFTCRIADAFLRRGSDVETDVAYRARLRNRWPAISLIPLKGTIELWSTEASTEIARISSDADPNVPGGILVTLASATGPATPIAQEEVEDYIFPRLAGFKSMPAPVSPTVAGSTSPREIVQASSAPSFQVKASATVFVPIDQLPAAKAGADQAWDQYLANLPIGDGGALVKREAFLTILGDLGATDVQGFTINGLTTDVLIPVGQVPVPATAWTLLANVTWAPGVGTSAATPTPAATVAPGGPFTATPQSIADLLPELTRDDVKAFLLAYLSVDANEVSDWESGAALRTYWEIESAIIQDLAGVAFPALAANGYPVDATDSDSLTQLAHGWYGIERALPSVATQSVTVACDGTHGPYTTAQVSALGGIATDGTTYHVIAGAAPLSSGGEVVLTFGADSPGLARGLVAALSDALPGTSVVGASIATFGSSGDSNTTVAAEIDGAFPDLSEIPTQDRTVFWTLAAAPPPLVTRFRLDADPAIPGGVLLTLANAGGPVAGGTITAVQAALDLLSPITDNNTAQNSTAHAITGTGTVTIKTELAPAAKAAADASWAAYLSGAQIGAEVFLEALSVSVGDAIKADPNSNFTGQALSGAGGDGNVPLAPTEVPIAAATLTSSLTWVLT